jgi:hypothetical protein
MGAECSVPCSAQNSFDKLRDEELRKAAEARAKEPGDRKWYERKKGAMTGRCSYLRMRARTHARTPIPSCVSRARGRADHKRSTGRHPPHAGEYKG